MVATTVITMKLKLNTIILLCIAILFGGGVWVWEQSQSAKPDPQEQAAAGTAIFSFSEDQVEQLTVKTPAQTLSFERSKQGSPPKTTWIMTAPNQVQADEPAISFLLNLLATANSSRTLAVAAARKPEFGLADPAGTIQVKLNNQQTHQVILGQRDFNQSSVYAQVDPPNAPTESLAVELLPTSFLDAIDRPLIEWEHQEEEDAKATDSSVPSAPN